MKNRIIVIISLIIGIIVFVLLIKNCYIDTKIGFDTQILELNYSSFPMFLNVIVFNIFFPFICYKVSEQFLDFLVNKIFIKFVY